MSHVDFGRVVGRAVAAMSVGAADRLSDETLFAFLGVVGSSDRMPDDLRSVLAAVVAELLLRPIESVAPVPAPDLVH